MLFYLIRHGQTDWNREGRLQGREDIPLNPQGRAEAHALGQTLGSLRPETILTSPLGRAVETARVLSLYTGGKISLEPGLTERDFGALSGRIIADVFSPSEEVPMEPLEAVSGRFLQALGRCPGPGPVLAVSHGGAINAVLRALSGGAIGSGVTRLKNLCVTVLRREEGRFAILGYNLTGSDELAPWL